MGSACVRYARTSLFVDCGGNLILINLRSERVNPFTPKFKKYVLPTFQREMYINEAVRIGTMIIFHLSKL